MSRCYPFPPPGYVKSAPLELDLSTKKEKRKHKDKKKKRKKHSAANGDLTIKEDDQQCKDIEKSRQPNGSFSVGDDKLPSATKSLGAIERLQTETFLDDAFSNRNLTTDSQREQRFKPRKELLSRSTLAAERLQGEDSKRRVLSKGVNGTGSSQSLQGGKSITEGLIDSGLATIGKRPSVDSSRVLPSGAPVASSSKRPEQAENSVFSNGVLSTKRKRLQADNAGDSLLSKSGLDANFRNSDGLQTGKSRPDSFMQATSSTVLQADNPGNRLISGNGLPADFERSAKRLRADQTELKVGTNGASSATGQVKNGEVPFYLLANDGDSLEDKFKPDVHLNGVMVTNSGKGQMNSSYVPQHMSGSLSVSKREESDKRKQAGKLPLMNPTRDSCTSNSPANRLNEQVRSGSLMASKCQRSDQVLQGTTNVLTTVGLKAEDKRLDADSTKGKVRPQDARATCEERSHIDSPRSEMRVSDVKIKPDKSCNGHNVPANSEHVGYGLQADGFKNRVFSNGILAGPTEKQNQPGMNLTSPVLTAAIGKNRAAPIKAPSPPPKVSLDFEEKSMKEKLLKLRIPHSGQAWVTVEDEDWLVPCKQQLQSKQGGQDEEAQVQQVWAETVLLPAVGLNALPYVIPN